MRPNQCLGFSKLLKYCWSVWRKGENERKEKAAEQDSIYRFKTKHFSSDEIHEKEVLSNLFPSYDVCNDESNIEETFADASDQKVDQDLTLSTHAWSFSPEELYQICCLHITMFSKEKKLQCSHQPSLDNYQLASYMVHSLQNLPGSCVDVDTSPI